MDWTHAIARHRAALLAIVAAVAALIGGRDTTGPIARSLRAAALTLLRPAESAARRLIVMAARGLAIPAHPAKVPFPGIAALARAGSATTPARLPAFALFDRPKRFRPIRLRAQPLGTPRIRTFWALPSPLVMPPMATPAAVVQPRRADPAAQVDATRLRLRLAALARALDTLPRQARRLARWRVRAAAAEGTARRSPLRPGRPPGYRQQVSHAVDTVLRECHALACEALIAKSPPTNTS